MAPVAAKDNDPIKDAVRKMFDISYVPVQSPAITKIYLASFYDVTNKIGSAAVFTTSKLLVARAGNSVILLEDTSTDQAMPNFLRTVKKDFKIKTDKDAELFESTLDLIFPMGQFDNKPKEIIRTGQTVKFVRGAFLQKTKGFILTLGPDGAVTGITYKLGIEP